MAPGDAIELIEHARHQHHQRDAGALGGRPEPVGGAVGEKVAVVLVVEGVPHAEHPRLLLPVGDPTAAGRVTERQPAHHREPVGMRPRRLQRDVVAIAFPGGRHDDHAPHAGQIHLEQHGLLADRIRLLRLLRAAGRPRALGRVGGPEVHLRIDDVHARASWVGLMRLA